MAIHYHIHPEHPQNHKIAKIATELRRGALILYPTDTVHAIGCDITSKNAVEKIRHLRKLASDKPLTFLCHSLTHIAEFAHVSDAAYRIIKHLIPGPYTFILPATKLVPKLVQNPKRKTTGIRVPDHKICTALLNELNNPIVSMAARLPFIEEIGSVEDLFYHFEKHVDIIIDDESPYRTEVSTMIDMSAEEIAIGREGMGLQKALQYI